MPTCDTLIRNALVLDGSGDEPIVQDVALEADRIAAIGTSLPHQSESIIEADGLALAPGFVDAHTHDDLYVLSNPEMLPKLSQGVTTVIVGNCGISAAPVRLRNSLPDPMNLLGAAHEFQFPNFAMYTDAVHAARPAVNVGALVGHTAVRNNHMDRLDRAATETEIGAMRNELGDALAHGALGLSTGLAYASARSASTAEVLGMAQPLADVGAIYTTHMRTEADGILDAMEEAFTIGRERRVPVVISHLKCAGIANWGRADEVLATFDSARSTQAASCDCYPYAAGSSTLDLGQVDPRVEITITWSEPHPELGGRSLASIAELWQVEQIEAARRSQPAGAIYHSISEADMRKILAHPASMIGSDGLPRDPRPHPRLWGTFPRVLGRYAREEKLLSLPKAIHKMTALPAQRFNLGERGLLRPSYHADLVLFDPNAILDAATFTDPIRPSLGIHGVWVNGTLSYNAKGATGSRAGRFLSRASRKLIQ